MKEQINKLAKVNNLLVNLHPTGEDILIVAEAIVTIRSMLHQPISDDGGDSSETV